VSEQGSDRGPTELQEVLENGLDWMRGMKATLVEERSALESRDSERLAEASTLKEQFAKLLLSVDWQSTEVLLQDQPPNGAGEAVQQHWRAFLEIASDCERLNRTNGAIISARRQQVKDGLAILQGRNHNEDTYSQSGATAAASSRRTLTEA
jgi:flagellar biosynthesis/type III secretory pathway chaperone